MDGASAIKERGARKEFGKSYGSRSSDDPLAFWGKARPAEGKGPTWHPLPYHSLDVAAVAHVLLDLDASLTRCLAAVAQLHPGDLIRLLPTLLALHDLGKFARGFQAQAPDLYRQRLGSAASVELPRNIRHDAAGILLWQRVLAAGVEPVVASGKDASDVLRLWTGSVMAHHGRPVTPLMGPPQIHFGKDGLKAATAFARSSVELLNSDIVSLDGVGGEAVALRASWLIGGFATLCDWIGSHQIWFPYTAPTIPISTYWNRYALPRALAAIKNAGILPAASAPAMAWEALFPRLTDATHLQRWAAKTSLADGANLFVVEDLTGSGKTEAALMLAHRLIAAGRAEGLFIALPTQATANAMFDRVAEVYRRLFAEDSRPSLILSHSAARLDPRFRPPPFDDAAPAEDLAEPELETASTACAGWISDDRRRAFFADIAVGTIDQGLLAILPSRYQSLRLLGLSRRVLIVDEVHAYDPYMQQELMTLLRFHAAFGGSAILLSATLPQATRQHYLSLYQMGKPDPADELPPYPLASRTSTPNGRIHEKCLAPRTPRFIPVSRIPDVESALQVVVEAATRGAAVCWIRNAVDDVLDAAGKLRSLLPSDGSAPLIFHARFTACDRAARERDVLGLFGPPTNDEARENRRRGRIVVASQVVEQSLDLDFDLLVTDLAPIDLLIQRAGRLWRHIRPQRPLAKPELLVVAPELPDQPGSRWLNNTLPGTAAVYRDPARLWLTARVLETEGGLHLPQRARHLIETVYGLEALDALPPGLKDAFLLREGVEMGERNLGHHNVLKLDAG